MLEHSYAVIMAGGRGERFWPLSTSTSPKQLIGLFGGKPLLTMAVERLEGLLPPERILIITNAALVEASHKAAPQLPAANIIGEPCGRDTAPACMLASTIVKARDPEGVFAIVTADHVIGDLPVFHAALREGFELTSQQNLLMTIGITPTEPSTGFGYVEAGDEMALSTTTRFRRVKRFVEKPDAATAQRYIDSGCFYWNSGMFVWSVASFEAACQAHCPQLIDMADAILPAVDTPEFMPTLERVYPALEKISVDYALMEKADNIVTAVGTFAWDDVGAWPAIENHFDADDDGNVKIGEAEVLDAQNNIVVSQGRVTALLGVSDLVVVQAPGATLICPRDRAQDVKKMVALLSEQGAYAHVL